MTKRKWKEELKRRAIEAQRQREFDEIDGQRLREIKELDRRRLIGTKSILAIGHDGNMAPVRSVFIPAEPEGRGAM